MSKDEGGRMKAEGTRRLKPYPEYRDSDVEWLGEIPDGWDLKRLKRLVQFRGGGTPTKDNLEYWRGDIPWVSPKDMKVSVVLDTEDKITVEAIRESSTNLVPAGAVLIVVRSGILIHSIPVAITGCEVTLNQDLKALIPRSELAPEYLMYLISGMQHELLVEWKKEGATVESLELERIADTPTPLPALVEQRVISAFLDRETAKIDALVAKNEQLIELLQEKRTALIIDCVTGKAEVRRMKDENGNSARRLQPSSFPMKDSGVEWLGEIPAHWEVVSLKRVAPLQGRYAFNSDVFQSDGVPVVRMSNLRRGTVEMTDAALIPPTECLDKFSLQEGDLLVGMSGSLGETGSLGNYAIVRRENLPCQLNQRVGRFGISKLLDKEFLLFFLGSSPFTEPMIAGSTGTAQFNISPESIGKVKLGLPPSHEQRAIAAFLGRETAKFDALIAKIRNAIARLKEYRTALISAAVTGKIDVRGGK